MAFQIRNPLFLALPLLFLQGCAPLPPFDAGTQNTEESACLGFFEKMDELVERNGARDGGTARIQGFPHLRIDRFLASLAGAAQSPGAFAAWLEMLRSLDETARRFEAANLPAGQDRILRAALPAEETVAQSVRRCGKRLVQRVLRTPANKAFLLAHAEAPNAYDTWKRIAGVYPLTRLAAQLGIARLHRKMGESFRHPPSRLRTEGRLVRYGPPESDRLTRAEVGKILRSASGNALEVPLPEPEELRRLFETFAPIWEIDTRNRGDKAGEVALARGGRPWINIARPTVYRMHAWTRFRGKVLLQLVYQIWLPAREKTGSLDLYGGNLDSVLWRVTLSPDGAPLSFDSIHACGCYYMLFPGAGYRVQDPPGDGAEPVLAPVEPPEVPDGQRLVIRLQSRTHYIQQLYSRPPDAQEPVYRWEDYGVLRSLEMPDGSRRSLFAPDGLVIQSQRSERFLLWPFGVPSPGAMRQWGTHAIAFIGRRHFDDPFLFEKLLERRNSR